MNVLLAAWSLDLSPGILLQFYDSYDMQQDSSLRWIPHGSSVLQKYTEYFCSVFEPFRCRCRNRWVQTTQLVIKRVAEFSLSGCILLSNRQWQPSHRSYTCVMFIFESGMLKCKSISKGANHKCFGASDIDRNHRPSVSKHFMWSQHGGFWMQPASRIGSWDLRFTVQVESLSYFRRICAMIRWKV